MLITFCLNLGIFDDKMKVGKNCIVKVLNATCNNATMQQSRDLKANS